MRTDPGSTCKLAVADYYVDPQGLRDADKTMASTVVINMEGIPLRTTLNIFLKQLNLSYVVEGGLVLVVTVGAAERNDADAKAKPSTLDTFMNRAILSKLDERIAMPFPNETPLSDVQKYIETSTQDEAAGLPKGIPIYADPQALQDADKTMASTVAINLEGIPLRTTLMLMLRQLGLKYVVEGGVLRFMAIEVNPKSIKPVPNDGRGGGFQ